MLDPLREIELLEADRESWWLAYRAAIEFQVRVEREQGSATRRMLAARGIEMPVAPS